MPEARIRVTNTPDVLTEDVADIALCPGADDFTRAGGRESVSARGRLAKGQFKLTTKPGGKRAGIFGSVASAKRSPGGWRSSAWRSATTGATLQEEAPFDYFESADGTGGVVRLPHRRLSRRAGTVHMVNAQVLAALGAKGTLISIARGSVVDEAALVDALQRA